MSGGWRRSYDIEFVGVPPAPPMLTLLVHVIDTIERSLSQSYQPEANHGIRPAPRHGDIKANASTLNKQELTSHFEPNTPLS